MAVISPQPPAGPFLSPSRGDAIEKSSITSTASINDDQVENIENASSIGHKRKIPSLKPSNSTTTPMALRKRARLSIGTPGKVTPLAHAREREIKRTFTEHEVSEVYKVIRKQTGSLGGNAAGGAIYGEITQASFQRVVDYLKKYCELSKGSRFIDVGSGLGKPNLHVAVDPGVQVSYGIELEELRWHLSLHNLRSVLSLDSQRLKPLSTVFTAGDITHAHTFEPFSHVYSFDVGFPPDVMDKMADMFNRSTAKYYASFHTPRKVVDMYGFAVENIGRVATSMAGSSEGHQCYFYRRLASTDEEKKVKSEDVNIKVLSPTGGFNGAMAVDPLFSKGIDLLKRGREGMIEWVIDYFGQANAGRTRRQKRELREHPIESYYPTVKSHVAMTAKGSAQNDTIKMTKRKINLRV